MHCGSEFTSSKAPFHPCDRMFWWQVSQKIQKRICRHCKEPFLPKRHNWTRQHFCNKRECRQARKIKSQQRWLGKNPNHYKGAENVERMRQWRRDHPDRAKQSKARSKTRSKAALLQDMLQDSVRRNPLIIGLIADLYGCALQDFVEKKMRSLILRGMKIQLAIAGPEKRRSPLGIPA